MPEVRSTRVLTESRVREIMAATIRKETRKAFSSQVADLLNTTLPITIDDGGTPSASVAFDIDSLTSSTPDPADAIVIHDDDLGLERKVLLSALSGAIDHGTLLGLGDDDHTQYMLNGPTVTDNALARWDGTTGRLLQNSSWTLDDAGKLLAGPSGTAALSMGSQGIFLDDDEDSFIVSVFDDNVTFATGGSLRCSWTNDRMAITVPFHVEGNEIRLDSDEDSIIEASVDDIINISTSGTTRITITATLIDFNLDLDLNNNDLDDVASIDGGGNAVIFNDDIDLDGNSIILDADGDLSIDGSTDDVLAIVFPTDGDFEFSAGQIKVSDAGSPQDLLILSGADTTGVNRNSGNTVIRTASTSGGFSGTAGDVILQPGTGHGAGNHGQIEFRHATGTLVFTISNEPAFLSNARMDLDNNRLEGISELEVNNGVALGGGATATLGTIGGSGPTAAAQAQWLEIEISGVSHWIPVWT